MFVDIKNVFNILEQISRTGITPSSVRGLLDSMSIEAVEGMRLIEAMRSQFDLIYLDPETHYYAVGTVGYVWLEYLRGQRRECFRRGLEDAFIFWAPPESIAGGD